MNQGSTTDLFPALKAEQSCADSVSTVAIILYTVGLAYF